MSSNNGIVLGTAPESKILSKDIPSYLKLKAQWLLWKYENNRGGKPSKVPYQIDGIRAKVDQVQTLNDFEAVYKHLGSGAYDGLGFAFVEGDGLVGIDLDHCFGSSETQLEHWANELVEKFQDSYIELSPSGDGLHIWCLGQTLKTGQRKWEKEDSRDLQGIEVYNYKSPRYLTVTGDCISSAEISNCQNSLDWLYGKYFFEKDAESDQVRNYNRKTDLALVQSALSCVSSDGYDDWIKIGMALKAGGMDFSVWDAWSSNSHKYQMSVCMEKWNSFSDLRVTLSSLFYLAKKGGFSFDDANCATISGESVDWTTTESFDEPRFFEKTDRPAITSGFLPTQIRGYVDVSVAI